MNEANDKEKAGAPLAPATCSGAASVRFATTEGAEFAIDWMLKELIALNPAGESHYRKVARATLPPNDPDEPPATGGPRTPEDL